MGNGIAVLAFALLFLSACGNFASQDVQTEYSDDVAKLGLTPVYPPREDVQVGDIYLLSQVVSTPGESIANWSYLNSVSIPVGSDPNIIREAEKYMKTRVVFQKTVGYLENDPPTKTQPDQFTSDSNRFQTRADREIKTLPIVAFPEITVDSGFSNSVGIVRALAAVGLAGAGRTKVTLDFVDVRSYGIPKARTLGTAQAAGLNTYGQLNSGHNELITEAIQAQKFRVSRFSPAQAESIETDMSNRCFQIAVVNKVYMTRQINYTYNNARIVAAALKRAVNADATSEATDKVPGPIQIAINLPASSAESADDANVTSEDLNNANAAVSNLITNAAQGEGLSFQSWDALGMKFVRKYERPVIIAYEGVIVQPPTSLGEKLTKAEQNRLEKIASNQEANPNSLSDDEISFLNEKITNYCLKEK